VARFEASRRHLGHKPLAAVAHGCGYADQGHLTRDWSDLAGCPPTTWLREEFPFLQDDAGADPAV
jgi:AraC-like DNA-binding protein